jgi:hypothetical protein
MFSAELSPNDLCPASETEIGIFFKNSYTLGAASAEDEQKKTNPAAEKTFKKSEILILTSNFGRKKFTKNSTPLQD